METTKPTNLFNIPMHCTMHIAHPECCTTFHFTHFADEVQLVNVNYCAQRGSGMGRGRGKGTERERDPNILTKLRIRAHTIASKLQITSARHSARFFTNFPVSSLLMLSPICCRFAFNADMASSMASNLQLNDDFVKK